MGEISKAVLITGCSSGIGEATARRLTNGGWTVYATARRLEAIEHLKDAGCRTLALDVTDEASMRAAVDEVERAEGAVGVLVNNAGYSQGGAIEQVPLDAVRAQFETNVFGPIALTQMVLGGMRAQHWGKVVNIGSMGGRLTFPGGGFYHATKYSLEAISDALRFEVRGFGIDVVLIEPGLIVTEFAATAVAKAGDGRHCGWPVCRVRREGLDAHHGCLRRPDAPPRRRPGRRREGDREGDLPPSRALAGAGDGLGAPVDPAAQAHSRIVSGTQRCGPSFPSPSRAC